MAARLRAGVPVCASLLFLILPPSLQAQDAATACPNPALAPVIASPPDRSQAPLIALARSLDANNSDLGIAQGEVELFRADQYLATDRLLFNPSSQLVQLPEPFIYRDAQVQLAASNGSFIMGQDSGAFEQVRFSLVGSTAHGGAESVQLGTGEQTFLDRIWFTTCPGGEPQWQLSADQLELRHDEGVGIARHAKLQLGSVPVLYLPWMSFPIDDRRKSGFLYPRLSTANDNGVELGIPYYWNIAPNQDATFYPRYFTDRGFMLGGEYRFLTPRTAGALEAEVLPSDKNTRDTRHHYLFGANANINAHWNATTEFERVSDNEYFQDFGGNLVQTSRQFLRSHASITGSGRYWIFSMLADGFQVIDPAVTPGSEPYHRLPRAAFLMETPLGRSGLLFNLQSELVYFHREMGITGARADIYPTLSWSTEPYWGFVRASAGYRETLYSLDLQGASGDENPSRGTPILSVDAGTFLERTLKNGNTQTLEPRVFYLYVPYEDQQLLPDFDTGELTFGFASLFNVNRFTGADRQSDANQITLAASTRSIDDRGREDWRINVGQILYIESPRVSLSGDLTDEPDSSPLLGEFHWRPLDRFSAMLGMQWNWEEQNVDVASLGLAHTAARGNRVAFGYRFRRDRVDQFDLRYYWPMNESWRSFARVNYSLEESDLLETAVGVEYESCCWALRAVARRYLRDRDGGHRDALYLELQLKGLGSFGRNAPSFFGTESW
jgi:LPS-assembly protein